MSEPEPPHWGREALTLAILYAAAAAGSMALARAPGSVAGVWFANAVGLGYLLTAAPRRWPALLASAAGANLLVNWVLGDDLAVAVAFVPANVIEIVLGAALMRRVGLAEPAGDRGGLRSPRSMLWLLACGALLPQAVSASVAAMTLQFFGMGRWSELWLTWFQGSVLGAVSLLALVVCLRRDGAALAWRELGDWRVAALGCAAAGVALLSLAHVPFPFVYVATVPVIAAVVVEMAGALAITFAVSLVVAVAVSSGVFVLPPFASRWEVLFVYTAYVAALLPAQLLAAAIAQMRDGQARLRDALHSLQAANEGLEQFVRIASHDLREPLNTIVQFTALTRADHGAGMAPEALRWLGLVQGAGEQMRVLLDDVLAYVRVQRAEPVPPSSVDLDTVVHQVLQLMAARVRDSGAVVAVEALPAVRGSASLLVLVFQNLLSNALKFVPPGRAPHVVVTARAEGTMVAVEVADNGIGIAAEDLPRLFKPFVRLNVRRRYPGTGLGLALVRQA
ncbi:MAG TPA: ATP-binding protein, partial [Burkholderiaceae bacterium]|nr:ATP-binding protein [Burkholderiaceae bacterium]